MIGVTRGFATLVGAALAGILLWFAGQLDLETSSGYWAAYGLIAVAGLAMALSQLLGGWTKWGWPRFSRSVFLGGFLPILVAGLWVVLAHQPADWMNTSNWSRDLGIHGVVADLGNVLPAIGFGVGLVFGLSFDTAGPRREASREASREVVEEEQAVDTPTAEEPPTADRDLDADAPTVTGAEQRHDSPV